MNKAKPRQGKALPANGYWLETRPWAMHVVRGFAECKVRNDHQNVRRKGASMNALRKVQKVVGARAAAPILAFLMVFGMAFGMASPAQAAPAQAAVVPAAVAPAALSDCALGESCGWENENFQKGSTCIGWVHFEFNLSSFGCMDNRVSSIANNGSTCNARWYENASYGGGSILYPRGTINQTLGAFNNKASSAQFVC